MLKSRVNIIEKDRSWELPQKKKTPSIYNKSTYTVTWYNYNGKVLEVDNVVKGNIPVYKGVSPTRESTSECAYRFVGWSSLVEPVTCNTEYTAIFGEIPNVPYLIFSSPLPFTIYKRGTFLGTLESSVDGITWTVMDISKKIFAQRDKDRLFKLYLRGTGNTVIGGSSKGFALSGTNISIIGNIETLLDYQTVVRGEHPTMGANCMHSLFKDNTSIASIDSLLLPTTSLSSKCYYEMFSKTSITRIPPDLLLSTTLATYCYCGMFRDCTLLTTLPNLPAMELVNFCYDGMFRGCTSLTSIPSNLLPATTLANGCYQHMFQGCTSLTSIPSNLLPATTLTTQCYSHMFKGCTSLTSIPKGFLPGESTPQACYFHMFQGCISLFDVPKDLLPSQVVGLMSYSHMFQGCISLITAPELPATTLGGQCYAGMFSDCTSLTIVPELPATTLVISCYADMFSDCTSLTTIPSNLLHSTTLANNCYYGMFRGCTSLTNIPKLPATTLQNECYNSMFSGCTSIKLSDIKGGEYSIDYRIPFEGTGTDDTDALTNMFKNTGGIFKGTPAINTTYYTSNTIV